MCFEFIHEPTFQDKIENVGVLTKIYRLDYDLILDFFNVYSNSLYIYKGCFNGTQLGASLILLHAF